MAIVQAWPRISLNAGLPKTNPGSGQGGTSGSPDYKSGALTTRASCLLLLTISLRTGGRWRDARGFYLLLPCSKSLTCCQNLTNHSTTSYRKRYPNGLKVYEYKTPELRLAIAYIKKDGFKTLYAPVSTDKFCGALFDCNG